MTPIAIEVDHLSRQLTLGGELIPVLNEVSFEIAAGEWIALTGSGKVFPVLRRGRLLPESGM